MCSPFDKLWSLNWPNTHFLCAYRPLKPLKTLEFLEKCHLMLLDLLSMLDEHSSCKLSILEAIWWLECTFRFAWLGTWICTVKGVKDMYVLVLSGSFPLMFTPDSCLALQTLSFHQQSVTFWWPNLLVKRLHLQHLRFLLCPSPMWVVHKVKLLVLNWYLPMYSATRQILIGLMQSELEKRECLNHMPKVIQIRTEA